MTTPQDKAWEALRLADICNDLARRESTRVTTSMALKQAEKIILDYAALLQAQPAEVGVVHVCPTRDIECGSNSASWCRSCPKRPAEAGRVPLTDGQLLAIAREEAHGDTIKLTREAWPYGVTEVTHVYRSIARAIERHHGILPKEQP